MSFMLGEVVTMFDLLRYFIRNIFPFKIVVYHFVADGEFILIKLTWLLIKKVGGGRFCINPLIRAKIAVMSGPVVS